MHYLERSIEVLSDLENANVLGHILAHHEDFDNNSKAYATFFTKVTPFKGHVTNSGRDTTVDPYTASLISFVLRSCPTYFLFHHVTCYVISFTSPSAYRLLLTTHSPPLQILLQSLGQPY
jgi:hypothetical protein